MKEIYFDESGNTGENLLDKEQPYFILASCDLSDSEAKDVLSKINAVPDIEKHFSKLKKIKKHQDSIIEILSDSDTLCNRVSITIIDKKYMVACKIVDILIEHILHEIGFDLYKNGGNQAMANVLYSCLPAFYKENNVYEIYSSFCKMIKHKDAESIKIFYTSCYKLRKSKSKDYIPEIFDLIHASSFWIQDILTELTESKVIPLDPAIPSLFSHAIFWGDKYPSGFLIFHDYSKPIVKSIDFFNQFMDSSLHAKTFGYDRRKFTLPLKATSISMEDSQSKPQIQITDILSGSMFHLLQYRHQDDFAKRIEHTGISNYINFENSILPSTAVTPEDLNTVDNSGCNPVNGMASYLSGK